MSFEPHFSDISNRCHSRLNLLKCLRGTDWGAHPKTLLHLYKQVVRPIIDYGSISFLASSKTQRCRLQKIQNQAIRIALHLPRYTPISWLHELAGIEPLDERHKQLALNYIKKTFNFNSNSFMKDFINLYSLFCSHHDVRRTPLSFLLEEIQSP